MYGEKREMMEFWRRKLLDTQTGVDGKVVLKWTLSG
jgi:hypothetical protein